VSTYDIGGGAEKVAWDLFRSYRRLGYQSWLAVGQKRSDDPGTIPIPRPNRQAVWARLWLDLENRLEPYDRRGRAIGRVRTVFRTLANPRIELESRFGIENYNYPSTHRLLELPPSQPDIVHCHNLHGGYFDPRVLPLLSRRATVVFTLHDAWLLSGHCAHSFDCERWKTGCGSCPDLTIYPAIGRDATSYNWRRKRAIFAKSRLNVATPCRWLMEKVKQSMLAPAIGQSRVIPYGIDLNVFRPEPKDAVRAALGLPQNTEIVLFTANGIRRNIFKDFQTMRTAIARVAADSKRRLLFLAVGENGPAEHIGKAEVRFIPYQKDPAVVARYYQAADVYVHGAKADTFPNTVLEALACGTPVVATAVGGIPEQVRGLNISDFQMQGGGVTPHGSLDATGILTVPGDADTLAAGIRILLTDAALRERLGENAAQDAIERFDLNREVNSYLDWYREILGFQALQSAV
jgi:glycosyltransferase involved in cell wall biosynthesis